MPNLTVGVNSYGTLADANTYLDGSIRAGSTWVGYSPDKKRRALISAFRQIEAQRLKGTAKGVELVATAAISAGGTGYAKGDVLTVSGGTFGEAAEVEVTTVAAGVVTAISLIHAGTYTDSDTPTSPAATTGGGNDDCTLTLTFGDQTAHFPATGLTDCDGIALADDEYPTDLKGAQFELAYEMAKDSDLELSSGSGSNIRRVKAGSAEVEYFQRQSDERRFPVPVQSLLVCFLAGSDALAFLAGFAGDGGQESVFDELSSDYGLTSGF